MKELSIIIPTYNRKSKLEKCLNSFLNQSFPLEKYEILIIDDGSNDGTYEFLKENGFFEQNIKYFSNCHKGPAAARNEGIRNSQGNIILIINDDTIATFDLTKQHMDFHKRYPQVNIGMLGFITWSPEIEITPFMKWLEQSGLQFDYSRIKGTDASWKRFWTCNVSLKKKMLVECGMFDETFPYASWEDVELGYRLSKQKFMLYFNRDALAYHYHAISLASAKYRMKIRGFSSALLENKVPIQEKLTALSDPAYRRFAKLIDSIFLCRPVIIILEKIASWAENRVSLGLIFEILLLHYRIEGIKQIKES